MGNDGEKIIGLGVQHSRRRKNVFAYIVHVFLRGGAFQHAPEKRIAVGRVVEFRSRFRDQGIEGEYLQGLFHTREMTGAVLGDVSFAVAVVVTDTSQMPQQCARGDRRFFLGKDRTILLDGRVEVQLAALPKLQNGDGGDGFGDGCHAEQRRGGRGSKVFQIRHTESRGPGGFTLQYDSHADSGHGVCRHETRNRLFDLHALFRGKAFLLRGSSHSAAEKQGQQAKDVGSKEVGSGKPSTRIHWTTSRRESIPNRGCLELRRAGPARVLRASPPAHRNALTLG